MAGFIRHIGKHGDRKVAIVFREVPGEPHMCLVVYTELLNQHVHDPLIQCIESDIGQNSESLADALNRSYTKDGKPILQTLHKEGQLKKVNTSLVVMTPAPNTVIRLDELNKLLDEMKQGEDAVKRLAEMDKSMGMQGNLSLAKKMKGATPATNTVQSATGGISDIDLAKQRIQQAEKMEKEANGLLAEAKRLMEEAKTMDPSVAVVSKPKRGRPPRDKSAV